MGTEDITALEELAAELAARGYETRLLTPDAWRPSLAVRNPRVPALSETVLTDGEWFWWSWAERIAAVADVTTAATAVARVLAVPPQVSQP